jgi:hypothetical protein
MTETTNAAGSSPGGVSDVRSTAIVNDTIPNACDTVRRCSFASCLDDATVPLGRRAYCDVHAVDVFAPLMRTAQLAELRRLPDYRDDVIDIDDYVGQARFHRYDLFYPRRGRVEVGRLTTKTFRQGHVKCDRCGASWVGVELELCPWCLRRVASLADGSRTRRDRNGGNR